MAAFIGPRPHFGREELRVRCYLRYQMHNLLTDDPLILCATSNHAGGTTVLVLQEDTGPRSQSYLKVIGTLDQRDSERINDTARPQNGGAHQSRGGPRIGSRFQPDIESARVSQFSPHYNNTYPANYGVLPAGPVGVLRLLRAVINLLVHWICHAHHLLSQPER